MLSIQHLMNLPNNSYVKLEHAVIFIKYMANISPTIF